MALAPTQCPPLNEWGASLVSGADHSPDRREATRSVLGCNCNRSTWPGARVAARHPLPAPSPPRRPGARWAHYDVAGRALHIRAPILAPWCVPRRRMPAAKSVAPDRAQNPSSLPPRPRRAAPPGGHAPPTHTPPPDPPPTHPKTPTHPRPYPPN